MNERSVFLAVLEIGDPAERAAYLDQACAGDPAVRQGVEDLLAAHGRSGSFMGRPAAGEATAAHEPVAERRGTVIGPYKLMEQIGEGGMGLVFVAQQEHPVRRKVALKIIKPGMDSAQVIARFEAERQALAMMEHQNIAKVYDAGTTESGLPYFVMELVHGVPITKYCDAIQLTPRQRLELFVPVCQAIQHAHQKGIIHRDIKPSNILVTMYDDQPVPKVIDFGVAKAIEQRLTEKTVYTQFATLVGTFEYMSPEQAEMNAFGVDTRSDIYSLGVLLYELLTGTTPLESKRLRVAALNELVRLIKEEEAPRPSVRLSSSDHLAKIAADRKTEPAKLSKLVRGEIDWIVMKCLEKDRSRRYDTASGLARDVERYLADEAVEACPPSASYRLRKFARKHRKALATVAAFAVLLVAGVVLSTSLAVRATSAEREANRQRIASDAAKQEALNARGEADKQRDEANRQRIASDAAKQEALNARGEADKQRDEARLDAYASGMGLAQHAWDENNVLRARELLAGMPTEAAGRDLRGFEWYYLSRLCHSEAATLKGHSGYVLGVAFSPDGRRVASGSADRTVKVWDSTTSQKLVSFKCELWPVTVAFSPDGRRLASGSKYGGVVQIWDITTGNELVSIKRNWVRSLAFSPDGQRLAAVTSAKMLKVWDSATGQELVAVTGHADVGAGHVDVGTSVAFSPDGLRLASGSRDNTVKIWESATGKELVALKGHASWIQSVAFSPDGQRLASGSFDNTVKVWDSATGQELVALKGHAGPVYSVAFSPDGQRLASASQDNTVKVWDSATGQERATLKGHTNVVTSVAFSLDGERLASGSQDSTVKIWDSATGPERVVLKGHANVVTSVAFSPDGRRLASGSQDNMVKIWDNTTARELVALKGHAGPVRSVAFSPDGQRLASGSNDTTVKIWDSATGQELISLSGHAPWVSSVAFSPDGQRLASGGQDKTVKIWDSATGKELISLECHNGYVHSVAFSPDGQRLAAVVDDKLVKIWDSATGKELATLMGHGDLVYSVAFSPDGRRLASASQDNTVRIWDSATGHGLVSLKGHANWVRSVAFSPDGRRLASGSDDNTVKIWDSATAKELVTLKGQAGNVRSVAFSPDGQRLASSNQDGSIILWETNVSPEVRERRAANQVVADLFGQLGLRGDVLAWLQTSPGMSPSRRQAALAAVQTCPENPSALNDRAWELVKLPGREMSDYRQALRYSEEACPLEPNNGVYLTTLGVAQYRVGNDDKALETLLRADEIHLAKSSNPADLAFLAMTQQRLGHAQEAQAYLQRLRECMKISSWAQNADAQGILREAEALLAQPATPRGK